MSGPSSAFLANLVAAMDQDPFAGGANAAGIQAPPPGAPAAAPAPPADPLGAGAAKAGLAPITLAPDPEKFSAFAGSSPTVPGVVSAPGVTPAPAPFSAFVPPPMALPDPTAGPPPPPQVQAQAAIPFRPPTDDVGSAEPPQDPDAFPLVSAGGAGVSPAHEVERRGPSLLNAQGARNDAAEGAIENVVARNESAATDEYNMALDQERSARLREQAQQQSLIEQQQELQDRQDDFDGTVKQLSKMGQLDHGRFYASLSTPQKVAGFVELMLSGFTGAPSMMMKRVDDDIKAQEFAYNATRDVAQAKQTAFSNAMAKYQNVSAARAAARASTIDVIQAQLAQMSAKWKGTEAANRADIASADLQNEKMMQIAQGIQFVPAQSRGRQWIDPRTGLVYSEQEAKAIMAKRDDWGQADRTQVAGIGGQMLVQGAKVNEGAQKDQGERSVVVDGKDALAVNKTAAEKWNEYNHGRAVFNLALNKLKDAREAGDVGAYDAARAQLIEEYPKLLGYTRAPSEGQISHTVGPNAIPEYNHWYNHASTLGATYPMAQGRAEQKIKFLEETLATSDKAMRANTFGAAGSKPGAMPSTFGGYKK